MKANGAHLDKRHGIATPQENIHQRSLCRKETTHHLMIIRSWLRSHIEARLRETGQASSREWSCGASAFPKLLGSGRRGIALDLMTRFVTFGLFMRIEVARR